jgi:hypothetical protein
MKHCLLLFLSAKHLHAQHMAGGKIVAQREFSDSPDGRANFATFLQNAKYPTYLLADLIEEDFRHETVPHLSGGSRTALLQRKFEQFHRGTPFRQATLLQRQKTGRRDDDMLFSALTNHALIAPWLEIMLAQQTPLAGIYSVPQISAPLVENHPSNHLLLISWEKFAGLRQTYFSEHRLQISRLTPIHAGLTFHAAVANELAHTCQYLKSLSLLPSGQTLDVRILCDAEDRAELEAGKPSDGADISYEFADLNEVARQLKVDYRFTDSDASQIFLHLLAAKPPKANYANAGHRHYHQLWQLRRGLNWSSVALLLCSLSLAATDIWQSSSNTEEVVSLNTRTQHILGETQQITHTLPNIRTPASDMKTGVSVMRKLDQYAPVPSEILHPISAMLDRYPQIELDELSWQTNATEPIPASTLADVPAQIITLNGHLTGFANDYRAALNYLERFQRDLTAQGYQVTALAKSLDLSPGGSIAGQREARANAFGFSLKLFRRLTG